VTPKPRRRKAVELDPAQHRANRAYGRRWQQISDQALARAHYRCEIKLPGICVGRATVADHVVAVDEGGPSVLENAQAACKPCNQAKSFFRRVERAGPASSVPSAADLDGYTGGCARSQGGPHNLSEFGGPSECYGQRGHASRDWSA
jgi:HNH endonuclease